MERIVNYNTYYYDKYLHIHFITYFYNVKKKIRMNYNIIILLIIINTFYYLKLK